MRWVLGLVMLVPVLAGCLGGGSDKVVPSTDESVDRRLGDPLTLDGILNRSNPIKIDRPLSIKWEFKNMTGAWRTFSSLLHFSESMPLSGRAMVGDPFVIAFVPLELVGTVQACQGMPSTVKDYFQPRDGSTSGNLSGRYGPGWYHLVIVAKQTGSFTATFNSSQELKPIKPQPNAYVNGTAGAKDGALDVTLPVDGVSGTWFTWATHRVPPEGVDAGRDHEISIGGDCSKVTRTTNVPPGQPYFTNTLRIQTSAAGTMPSFDVRGVYRAHTPVVVPDSTVLEAAWVWIQTPEVPTGIVPADA